MGKIIIFKNDRGGDLLTSLKCISVLVKKKSDITLFLSEINHSFSFLFKNVSIKKINFNLNIYEKLKFFFFFLFNNIDEVYILTPKNYYFYLPFFFRSIKFYAIVVDGKKRHRPPFFFRKYLYKYKTVNRRNNENKISLEQMQFNLVTDENDNSNFVYDLNFPKKIDFISNIIPKNFYFFQFKKRFFENIEWDINKLEQFFKLLLTKTDNIVFCSDIENTDYNHNFLSKYSYINFEDKSHDIKGKTMPIVYLHNITGENLFYVIKLSKRVICPHGLISHISRINKISTLALFDFKITTNLDYWHQKRSFSEWYPKKSFEFAFLNKNFDKALKKISTRI